MGHYIITFRSVTYAQRGERILKNGGYPCTLGRTPRWMEEQGCGYALWIRCRSVREPLKLLDREKVPLRRVYSMDEQGRMEVWSQ